MEKFIPKETLRGSIPKYETSIFRAMDRKKEKDILADFTPEQQEEIRSKQQILSSLAYFIGKDFRIPVELNEPGAGWHWDFQKNVIRIDPKDLLEKSMDYLRFVISHEGGHRRISRTDFIPIEVWRQPGFSFMMNAIEDPRDNNFVAESYPKFGEQMGLAYKEDLDFSAGGGSAFGGEAKAKERADQKLGYQPRFMQAGFEYIKQWFREVEGKDVELSEDLPADVKAAVQATLDSARDSWLRYPSREEADKSEEIIKEYAKVSYETNRDEVWPEFKKLVEADMSDQKTQELLKDMQQKKAESGGAEGLPQELKDKLTPEEQKELEEAIGKAIEDAKNEAGTDEKSGEATKPINLDSLSEEVKRKIKEYLDSLPEAEKKEIAEKAEAAFKEFEDALSEELQGKLSEDPEKKAEREDRKEKEKKEGDQQSQGGAPVRTGILPKEPLDTENLRTYRERLSREINKDENEYEKYRREVVPLIERLESELRRIFVDRKTTAWKGGFTSGKRIDIKKRIQEKAKSVPAMESKAWQKRELPDAKDISISLLVDLSGSMRERSLQDKRKIDETFKSVIVLAEALNNLGINLEIVGFNDDMYEYQNFGQPMSKGIREHIGGMLKEVENSCCAGCGNEHSETDLGWALQTAAERLAMQKTAKKMMIVLTDGKAAESTKHPRQRFDPETVRQEMRDRTDIVPLDIGSIAGKTVEQIIESLKDLLESNV